MKAGRKRNKWQDVPTASMSDIAFLLIIFFILTTTLEQLAGITSEMPSGKRSDIQTPEKTPTIQVHEDKIMWNEKAVDMATLRDELQKRNFRELQGDKKVVLLEASGEVPYQTYYEVLAAINGAGGMVALVTEEKDKSAEKKE